MTVGTILSTYHGHAGMICDIAWAPNANYVASASQDQTVQIWDATTGLQLFTHQGYASQRSALAWSPDGTGIASAGENATVQIWQTM